MSTAIAEPAPQSFGLPPGLDQVTLTVMARDVIGGLPVGPDASPREIAILQEGAVAAALDFRPRNPREATLAACTVNAHRASADCFHRATLPDVPDAIVLRYLGVAASLARLAISSAAALQSLQRQPQPPVLRAGSAASLIAAMSGRPAGQAAADAVSAGKDPMHRGTAPAGPGAAAQVGQDPMHRETASAGPGAAARVGQDPMHRETAAARPEAAARVGQDPIHQSAPVLPGSAAAGAGKHPMHRGASIPQPAVRPIRGKDLMSSGASMLALAAMTDADKDPMHRGAPALPPAAGAMAQLISGAVAQPRSAIALPASAEELRNARLADEQSRMGREGALARGA